jgi:ubiquinone/menaquinone biosynthesis C-methylase UbiE
MVTTMSPTILVLYTTLYREGGQKFARAAATLAAELQSANPLTRVICQPTERKAEFVAALQSVADAGSQIQQLHFIGHSGMYGIMFGSTAWPEQLSPHEWRSLKIAFAPGAEAFFHACRTGRWFAAFFARTFGVRSHGYFWYTTLSTRKDRFAWDALAGPTAPLYIISVPGKKSHGLGGSAWKYGTRPKAYPLLAFEAVQQTPDTTYDAVAPLYDAVFEDIAVRQDELQWLRRELQNQPPGRLLDIGCGTGAFLRALTDLVVQADGVDLSQGMIDQAIKRSWSNPKLHFTKINGPQLPFADDTFDVVTSVLSFRYLDWDPVIAEILRVLKPGGRLLVVDMVAAPVQPTEMARFVQDKARHKLTVLQQPAFAKALQTMVRDPRWQTMLQYNPIRAEHEYKWYLQSRFPGGKLETLNIGWHARVLAYATPPLFGKTAEPMSYP